MLNVAFVELEFPHSSVAIKETVAVPVSPQPSLNAGVLGTVDQVTLLQISVAVAPPRLFSQVVNAALALGPHATLVLLAACVMLGLVESIMLNVAFVELEFPHSSVAIKETVAVPVAPQPLLNAGVLGTVDQVTPPQASVAVAPP
jgi:hypothetical protein